MCDPPIDQTVDDYPLPGQAEGMTDEVRVDFEDCNLLYDFLSYPHPGSECTRSRGDRASTAATDQRPITNKQQNADGSIAAAQCLE